MTERKLSRNSPRPCGSGKNYKHCCYKKGFDWVEDDSGMAFRSTRLPDGAMTIIEEQRRKFVAKSGLEPSRNDRVFFDLPLAEHLEAMMVDDMKKAGMDPAIIYVFEKTGGLLVTEDNQHLITDKDLAMWDAAIEEFEAQQRGQSHR